MLSPISRVLIVGCGGIARAHLSAIAAADVVGLCDSNLGSARRLQNELARPTPLYDTLEAALQNARPDAVIICTPPTTHRDLASRALRVGVAVLCEKPLATRATDAQMLVELAEQNGVRLRTSAKYRFAAGVVAAKHWPDLGALRRVAIAFGAPFDYANSWHSNLALSGGGVWMDNGPHALDLARFFAGELTVCAVEQWSRDGDLETETRVRLRGASGVHVQIALSWQRTLGDWFAELEGETGTIKIGWRQTIWQPNGGVPEIIAGRYDKSDCFRKQWQAFCEGDARLNAADGAQTVALIEAVYAMARADSFEVSRR